MGEFWNTGRMAFDDVAGMADAALELRRFVVSPFSTNCYAVVSCGKAMVVDPGAEGARIAEALSDVDVELVVATHGHADHVGGVAALVAATGRALCHQRGRRRPRAPCAPCPRVWHRVRR